MLSDTTLLTQAHTGDEASFETLFLRHYERVYKALFYLLGNQAEAEDLAQQVFLKFYHAPQEIQTQINVAGWLYRVAINEGYNALRSRKRRATWYDKLIRLWPLTDSSLDPASLVESQDVQAQVRQVLLQMKPREAQLLLLRHSGLSYAELAVALDLAPGSIGSLLTRAERAFAQKYRRAFPEEG